MKELEKLAAAIVDYPCLWSYRLIGADEDALRRAAAEIVQDRNYRLVLSRRSAQGKYQSFCLEVMVESEGHRLAVYEALRAHKAVKIIL